jgi:5,5'-dehydrodivanillate O-demethylase oxygenase subunit
MREDIDENHPMWTIGRVCLWPNGFFLGDHFEWRVPIDDEHTLSIAWMFDRVPNEQEPFVQEHIPAWRSPIKDPKSGSWITSHVMNQDFIAWVGQGTIADRTKEHLGRSDRGVVMLRKRLLHDLKAISDGGEPSGLIRDPSLNVGIELPIADRALLKEGLPAKQLASHPIYERHQERFVFQAGQPLSIWHAYRAAMGLEPNTPLEAHANPL